MLFLLSVVAAEIDASVNGVDEDADGLISLDESTRCSSVSVPGCVDVALLAVNRTAAAAFPSEAAAGDSLDAVAAGALPRLGAAVEQKDIVALSLLSCSGRRTEEISDASGVEFDGGRERASATTLLLP